VTGTSNPQIDPEVSRIAAVREAWNAAVKACDLDRLMSLVTDDVGVVNVDGRSARGKEEFRAEVLKGWALFDRELRFSSSDTIVRGKWAIDTMELERTLTAVRGGGEVRASVRSVAVLARQTHDLWKIARILILPD
jgi:uncharacterized protein (TIGR02246 family)